jgi:hypothetical protein
MLQADQWDKKTILTIDNNVQLPTTTLAPGTYVFRLMSSDANRHVVEVYDKDQRHLITRFLALPNLRLQPTGKTEVTFWEVPAGQPPAMRAWFYPGDNFGQEFMYPKTKAEVIAAVVNTPVPQADYTNFDANKAADDAKLVASSPVADNTATDNMRTPVAEAPVAVQQEVTPARQPELLAQNSPAPSVTPAPSYNTPADTATLPQTASNLPLIGALGLLAMALGFAAFKMPGIN